MSAYQPSGLKKIFHLGRRKIARWWLSLNRPLQIGITGSQGKTNTTQLLAKILSHHGPTVITDTNLDTIYNVPITALAVRPWTKYLVWELGIDHPDEMDLHLQIAKPTIGIITGISPVHTDADHLGSLEKLIAEKRKLIERLPEQGSALLNFDDPNVKPMANYTKAKVKFYGTDPTHCSVYFDPKSIKLSLSGTQFALVSKTSNRRFPVHTKLIGSHHPYNLAAVYLTLETIFNQKGHPINNRYHDNFLTVVNNLSPLPGRMSVDPGPLGTIILNDSLRANPESARSGLITLFNLDYHAGRKIAVLGVMGELEKPKLEHEKTAFQLIEYPPDYVICLGNQRKFTYDKALALGFPRKKIFFASDVFAAADQLKKIIKAGDLIYLKGSFLRNLKRIIQILNNEQVCCHADLCPYDHCGY